MAIQLSCSCGKVLNVPEEFVGRKARCKACGNLLTIPAFSPDSFPVDFTTPTKHGSGNSAPVPPPISQQEWFYNHDGQQKGAVTFQQLQILAESGQLTPSDLVWKAGMPGWTPALMIRHIFTKQVIDQGTPSVVDQGSPSVSSTVEKPKKKTGSVLLGSGVLVPACLIAYYACLKTPIFENKNIKGNSPETSLKNIERVVVAEHEIEEEQRRKEKIESEAKEKARALEEQANKVKESKLAHVQHVSNIVATKLDEYLKKTFYTVARADAAFNGHTGMKLYESKYSIIRNKCNSYILEQGVLEIQDDQEFRQTVGKLAEKWASEIALREFASHL